MLVRSPTMMKLVSGRIDQRLRCRCRLDQCGSVGRPAAAATPSTASAMAAIQSGVVPQQPPTMFSQPLRANSPSDRGRVVAVAVEAAEAVGHAGVGVATDARPADRRRGSRSAGRIMLDADGAVEPDAQGVEVRDRVVERLDRLGRERRGRCRRSSPRSSPAADVPVSSKYLSMANRHAFMTSVSNDVSGSRMSTPAVDQGADLLRVVGDHLVEGHVAAAGVLDVDAHRELLLGRPDAAGDEPGLVGVLARCTRRRPGGRARRPSCSARRRAPARPNSSSESGVAVEGVGLDDVGAGLEVGAVDVLDHLRLGEDQDLGAVLEVGRVVARTARRG